MNRADIRLKILLIILFIGIVPSVISGYLLHRHTTRLIMNQEKDKLKFIAEAAANNVKYRYEQSKISSRLEELATWEEKLQYLCDELEYIGERYSDAGIDQGLSIYSKDLHVLVVNAPKEQAGRWVGAPVSTKESPSLEAVSTGRPVFKILEIRRGKYALYSKPLVVNGDVIGAVNAMQSLAAINAGYIAKLDRYLGLVLALGLLLAVSGSIILIFSLDKFAGEILGAISRLKSDPAVKLPDAGGKIGVILRELQGMAGNLANIRHLTRVALETVDTGVITTDCEGIITFCNKEAERIFRRDRGNLVGQKYGDLFREICPGGGSLFLMLKTLQSGQEYTDEEIEVKLNGNTHYFLCNTRILANWEGDRIGVLCTLKDIDARKKLAELDTGGRMGQALREVAAGLAHEIKNPLTTVRGFLQLALTDGEQLPGEHYHLLLKELDRTLELLAGFRDLSRYERLDCTRLAPDKLIKEMVSLLKNEARSKGVTIDTRLQKDLIVCWDGKKVKQVLLNIMRNAFEAMPGGGVLTISLAYLEAKDMVKIDVADNGMGMDSEVLEKIGQPFFTTKEGGTGLGLTLTKSIVQQMNGYLTVSSRPGKGSTFSLLLPERIDACNIKPVMT